MFPHLPAADFPKWPADVCRRIVSGNRAAGKGSGCIVVEAAAVLCSSYVNRIKNFRTDRSPVGGSCCRCTGFCAVPRPLRTGIKENGWDAGMISHKYQMPEKNVGEDWYLLLSVSNNLYAVGLPYVFRITAMDGIQPVPGTKEYILGTIMAGDAVWPVADLRIKFGQKEPGYPRHPKGVLLEYGEYKT